MISPLYKLVIATVLLSTTGIANSAISLSFNPQTQVDSLIGIGIIISGLGASSAPSIATYDLDILFDASHLAFASAELGDHLDIFHLGTNLTTVGLTGPGVLNIYELSFDLPDDLNTVQSDSFTLAVLNFDVLNAYSSQLNLVVNALGDADGNPLVANVSSAVINPVPLPPAFFMMSSGLFSLVAIRKKRPNQVVMTNWS